MTTSIRMVTRYGKLDSTCEGSPTPIAWAVSSPKDRIPNSNAPNATRPVCHVPKTTSANAIQPTSSDHAIGPERSVDRRGIGPGQPTHGTAKSDGDQTDHHHRIPDGSGCIGVFANCCNDKAQLGPIQHPPERDRAKNGKPDNDVLR